MAPDVQAINRDPDLEWLDLIRPTGLVLSPTVIKERGLIPERQTAADSAAFAACLSEEGPALPEPWRLFAEILGWDAGFVAGAPGGPALPDDLAFAVPEHDTTLFPDWAVQGFGEDAPWQLLVRLEHAGVDPDRRGEADGWEASPHQRFERLLRETGVLVGILISEQELRLIYAPKGETSGWLSFPLRSLATVAGRPMLAGLKLVLGRFRLFNAPADQRLRALLKASRDAQAAVSTELSAQVLGALHELLRGLNAAEPSLIQDLAERRPDHLYEGLLTVLLRLVFILYAEDRDLLPSAADGASRALYEQSYSVRGLYAKLAEDDALNPDTMDERLGGWGRLLALFRLIHKGHESGFIRARRGKLFDPDVFPFLEGRSGPDDSPRVVKLSDGCVLRILEGLMTLADPRTKVRQRLSYRTLDVEQIGSVYETIMGFTVQTAPGRVLAIKAGRQNRTPVFAELERLAALKPAERAKHLKDVCKREGTLPKAVATALGQADDADAVAAALDLIADERGSPRRSALGAGTPILQPTEERRRTGSHYTPRDLTEPIVRHALRPILDRLGADATPAQILDVKVCDPAMGSGAFLVEACRQLADRLIEAWARHFGTRPPIPADEDEDLLARRLIAQRCLYGVDKNPMAVDLARLSLWLATLARELIATKTIRQGGTRATGLGPIRTSGGVIYRARRRIKWPGQAAVVIAIVHVHKGPMEGPYVLDDRPVDQITAFLFHTGGDDDPSKLAANANKSFQGSIVLGMGFTFDDQNVANGSNPIDEMHRLIERNPRNAERIFPYIGWEEVAYSPTHEHQRYVIDFADMNEHEARRWPDLMAILENRVKPDRSKKKRKHLRERWWQHAEVRPALRKSIEHLENVLGIGSSALWRLQD